MTLQFLLVELFWYFIFGSVFGYIHEILYHLIKTGNFSQRKGLIYGPFSQVYGIGCVLFHLILTNNNSILENFIITMLVGGIFEYIASWVQEKFFKTFSWNYSNYPFNFKGRTSLFHMTFWGLLGLLFVYYVEPLFNSLSNYLQNYIYITLITFIFMTFNVIISIIATIRQIKRRDDIEPKNSLDVFLDKYYPDQLLDKVYTNRSYIKEKENH